MVRSMSKRALMIEITLRTKNAMVRRTSTKARKILVMRAKKMRMAK